MSIADGRFEAEPAVCDQVITRITAAVIAALGVRHDRLVGGTQGRARDCKFRQCRAARKTLYCPAVEVARGKIHRGKVAAGAQQVVHQADTFEELRPIHIREQPHAGDDVAYRHVRRALPLMLVAHGLVRGRSLLA